MQNYISCRPIIFLLFFSIPLSFYASESRLVNISTRAQVGVGDKVLIGGFVVSGEQRKKLLIRALGPSLSDSGVTGALTDPIVQLRNNSGVVAENDDWQNNVAALDMPDRLKPSHPNEAAILIELEPGAYTAIVRGVEESTGIALIEVYDLGENNTSELINISTRGVVGSGDEVMIGGFVIDGTESKTIAIRALGLSLFDSGISDVLVDPNVKLFSAGSKIDENDNSFEHVFSKYIPDRLAVTEPSESVIVRTLQPGAYTAIVRGSDSQPGIALVEVYEVDVSSFNELAVGGDSIIDNFFLDVRVDAELSLAFAPSHGSVELIDNNVRYKADEDYLGADNFGILLRIGGVELVVNTRLDVQKSLDSIVFEDANFKACIDSLFSRLVNDLDTLLCRRRGIQNLSGIEELTSLRYLDLNANEILTFDYTLPALKELELSGNNLTVLDVAESPELEVLNISDNDFSEVDLSLYGELQQLSVSSNQLDNLDVSANPFLTHLNAARNQLESIELSNNDKLQELNLNDNQLLELDTSNNPQLLNLNVAGNSLVYLDVILNPELLVLGASSNQLGQIDVPVGSKLSELNASSNNLLTFDVSSYSNLKSLRLSRNALTSVDVNSNLHLVELDISDNLIEIVDVTLNLKLVNLDVSGTSVAEIDLSNNLLLENLNVSGTNIEVIDTSLNPGLIDVLQNLPPEFEKRSYVFELNEDEVFIDKISAKTLSEDKTLSYDTSAPTFGELTIDEFTGVLTLIPPDNLVGQITAILTVTDSSGLTDSARGVFLINPVNDPGKFTENISLLTDEDVPVSMDFGFSDPDNSLGGYMTTHDAALGNIFFDNINGTATLVPFADANGIDDFTITFTDELDRLFTTNVHLEIRNLNDYPEVQELIEIKMRPNRVVHNIVKVFDKDLDDTHTFEFIVAGSGSIVFESRGQFTYRPLPDFVGEDRFVVRTRDSSGDPLAFADTEIIITVF